MVKSKSIYDTRFTKHVVYILLLLVCSLLVRIFHYTPFMDGDEQRWIYSAKALSGYDVPELPAVYHSRVLFSLLLVSWAGIFGWSWLSFKVLAFTISLLSITTVALATRYYFGFRAALLAGIFYAFHPINILFDTAIIPDTLGSLLSSIAMLLFGRFLVTNSKTTLSGAGLLTGLLFSIKGYFVLFIVPFCLLLILFRDKNNRIKELIYILFGFGVGLFLAVAILAITGFMTTGDIFSFVKVYTSYSDQMLNVQPDSVNYTGIKKWFYFFTERLDYFNQLFNSYGQAYGVLTLWALIVLIKERKSPYPFIILVNIVVFILFLMEQPTYLLADRYLTVLLLPLALGAGYALDQLAASLRAAELLNAGIVTFIIMITLGAWEPNDHLDRYRVMEFNGIVEAQNIAKQRNIETIALRTESGFLTGLPECLKEGIPNIIFLPMEKNDGSEVISFLRQQPEKNAVFIPRLKLKTLYNQAYANSGISEVEPSLLPVLASMGKDGAKRLPVYVPYTSFRLRLSDLGVKQNGQLVGWLYSY